MLTKTQYERLPACFQEIVDIDRQLAGPVIDFHVLRRLAPQRRIAKRACQILIHQPRSGGLA